MQLVQNSAARLVSGTHKYDNISQILYSLHWLPVDQHIEFKVLLFTFKALNNAAHVISKLVERYEPARSLRSASPNLLKKNTYRLKNLGKRAFYSKHFQVKSVIVSPQEPGLRDSADSTDRLGPGGRVSRMATNIYSSLPPYPSLIFSYGGNDGFHILLQFLRFTQLSLQFWMKHVSKLSKHILVMAYLMFFV